MHDALIIGQGLAGSVLAWTLMQRGWDLAVVDDGQVSSSSRVAAGLINPVTGRRLAKTPDVDWLLPAAEGFYDAFSRQLGSGPLLHPVPMLRLFRSPLEVEAWDRRCEDPAYGPYLGPRLPAGAAGPGVVDPLGSGPQRRTAYLDAPGLLDHMARTLAAQGSLTRLEVQPSDIRPRDDCVQCGGLLAARAILCQGHRAMDSPWFGWLPFQPAKGEILTLETDAPLPQGVLNAGRWLLPLAAGRFRFGATYDWTTRDQEPSTRGRETLLRDLPKVMRLPDARLVAHRAGVRPGALDNAPIVGPHPQHPTLWIFNGFGSKGALQIPGYAAALADHLERGDALPMRVDVRRYADQAREPYGERCRGPRSRDRLTRRAQEIIAAVLRRGDWALDATLGRGQDTQFLARTVGPAGRVFACDVQHRALEASAARLATGAPEVPVELILTDHAELAGRLPPGTAGRIKGLMMNLGFLPGGPSSPATRPDTTLTALESLLPHLAPGGRATVVAYVGHPGGREEAEAVAAWLAARPASLFRVFLDARPRSAAAAPRLHWVHRVG